MYRARRGGVVRSAVRLCLAAGAVVAGTAVLAGPVLAAGAPRSGIGDVVPTPVASAISSAASLLSPVATPTVSISGGGLPTAPPALLGSPPPVQVGGVCVTSCSSQHTSNSTPNPGAGGAAGGVTAPTATAGGPGPGAGADGFGSGGGSAGGAFDGGNPAISATNTGSIHVFPPPVTTIGDVPGISFGDAPYLWPIFVLLDIVAAAAVVVVVRRTWSSPSASS